MHSFHQKNFLLKIFEFQRKYDILPLASIFLHVPLAHVYITDIT